MFPSPLITPTSRALEHLLSSLKDGGERAFPLGHDIVFLSFPGNERSHFSPFPPFQVRKAMALFSFS